jgi:hypothetical protein
VVPGLFVLTTIYLIGTTIYNYPVRSLAGLVIIALGLPVYFYFAAKNRAGLEPDETPPPPPMF